MTQHLLARRMREGQPRGERSPRAQLLGALREGVEIVLAHVDEALRIERPRVLDHALADLVLVELGAIGVDAAGGARQGAREGGRVGGALARRDPRAQSRGRHDDPHAIPPAQVPRGDRRDLLHHEVQGRRSLLAGPELDRGVDHQPHDVALLAFHLAHQQPAPPRAGLPRDALERIARHVVAQLAQLVALSRDVRGAAHLRAPARTPSAGRHHQRRERGRQDLDAQRVREEERHLVEPLAAQGCTADLERQPVDAPPPDAQRRDGHLDARPRPRGEIEGGRRHLDLQHARGQGPDGDTSHRLAAPVAQLGLEQDGAPAGRAVDARRSSPHHLEPRRAQPRDRHQCDSTPHRHRQEHRRPEGDHRRQARRGPQGHEACPGHPHVEGRACGMQLHRQENTCTSPPGALGCAQIRLPR